MIELDGIKNLPTTNPNAVFWKTRNLRIKPILFQFKLIRLHYRYLCAVML